MTIHCPNCGVGFDLEDGTENRAVCPLCFHEFQIESKTTPASQPVSAPSLAEETDSVIDDVLVSVATDEPPAKQTIPQEISEPLPKIQYTEPPVAKPVPRNPATLTESQEMLLDLSVRSARKDASQEIGVRRISNNASQTVDLAVQVPQVSPGEPIGVRRISNNASQTVDLAVQVPQVSPGEPPSRKKTEPPRVLMTQEFGQVTETPTMRPRKASRLNPFHG